MVKWPPPFPAEAMIEFGFDASFDDALEALDHFDGEPPVFGIASIRDRPLSLQWRLPGLLPGLTIPRLPVRARALAACEAIAAEALLIHRTLPGARVSYSRNRNHYAVRSKIFPKAYTYAFVPRAVDVLAAAGLLLNDLAPVWRRGWQSTFAAAPSLFEGSVGARLGDWEYSPSRGLIRIKDKHKQPMPIEWTPELRAMERDVSIINEMLSSLDLLVPGLEPISGTPLFRLGKGIVNPQARSLSRVFNGGTTDFGGRFFGHYVQSIPKVVRKVISMNGEPVAEPDFQTIHPVLVYAMAGSAPEGDAYDNGEIERSKFKLGMNILLNASSEWDAVRSLAKKLAGDGASWGDAVQFYKASRGILDAVKRKHPRVAKYFCSGIGLRCMRLDSDVARDIMLRLISLGIPTICVHDSFVCRLRDEPKVRETMDEMLGRALAKLRVG